MTVSPAPLGAPVVISSGTSLSSAINLRTARMFGIQMPTAWDAANLTFQASFDGVTYQNLYDDTGTEVTVTAAASRAIILSNAYYWLGIQYIKIRSGTSGAAVNQTADRTLIPSVAV